MNEQKADRNSAHVNDKDDAIRDAIGRFEATDSPVVTNDEQMKGCYGPFPLQALRRFLPEYHYAGRLLLLNLERRTNMSNDEKKAVEQLLAPMLKKTLFVAINRVVAPASAIGALRYGTPRLHERSGSGGAPLGVWPVHRGGRPGWGRPYDPVDEHDRRSATGYGRGAAHQARATQLRDQKMGAARGPHRYLATRVSQPVFALMPVLPCRSDRARQKKPVAECRRTRAPASNR
jgi:hypothetical protein